MKNIIVVDLGYGDCGKGTITDALVRKHNAKLVVRYNGGAQAAHGVVAPDGRKHIFNQFGSGTLSEGVETFLSKYMLFNPMLLVHEEKKLSNIGIKDAYSRLYVDKDALVTTPYHMYANQIREYTRGQNRHGSCGAGIGETVVDSIQFPENTLTAGDLLDKDVLTRKLSWHRELKQQQLSAQIAQMKTDDSLSEDMSRVLNIMYNDVEFNDTIEVYYYIGQKINIVGEHFLFDKMIEEDVIVYEGAQGTLLDQERGFFPYCTRSTTTPENALSLIKETKISCETTVVGCIRAYQTRHGCGPFVTQEDSLIDYLPDSDNVFNEWQRDFRVGWLDLVATRYAIKATGQVDQLAVTCMDKFFDVPAWMACNEYTCGDESFFEMQNQKAVDIKFNATTDLDYQTKLTNELQNCKPVYVGTPHNADEYISMIEEKLNVPVGVVSYGRTADDKEFQILPEKQLISTEKEYIIGI